MGVQVAISVHCVDCGAPRAGRSPRCESCRAAHRRQSKTQNQREHRGTAYSSRDQARNELVQSLAGKTQALARLLDESERLAARASTQHREALRNQPLHRLNRALLADLERLLPLLAPRSSR
ncbi:MAG: hypothetical protein ACYC3W_08895 [Candidatus Nanopelagicales bacterium]